MSIATDNPFAGRAARIGLWALPLYALLLGLSTVTHQPPVRDFDAYARYVTTDIFLVSHLGASIFGAGMAILGAIAVTAFLVRGRAARTAVTGLDLTTITNVFMSATFGSATFAQPGIGRLTSTASTAWTRSTPIRRPGRPCSPPRSRPPRPCCAWRPPTRRRRSA